MAQTWNPSQKNADITLSGGNLIATKTASGGSNGAAYGLNAVTTGRYYWEITFTTNSEGAGIGTTTSSVVTGSYLGSEATSMAWFNDSSVYNGASQVNTWATYTAGDTVCFALDLSSAKIWGRVGAAGAWNNAAIGSQNPAVGSQIGGWALNGSISSGSVVPGMNLQTLNASTVAKFAESSWIGAPPSGFGPFDPTPIIRLPLNAPLPQRTEIIGY